MRVDFKALLCDGTDEMCASGDLGEFPEHFFEGREVNPGCVSSTSDVQGSLEDTIIDLSGLLMFLRQRMMIVRTLVSSCQIDVTEAFVKKM